MNINTNLHFIPGDWFLDAGHHAGNAFSCFSSAIASAKLLDCIFFIFAPLVPASSVKLLKHSFALL